VYSLNVHPDHWQVGVGGELLSATHAGLAELGFSGAFLWVIEGNRRARDFYERRGWTRDEDQRIRDIQGVSVDEVRYSRSLAG
jgi:N-acetylglutamate synthase-like GNAT family acetyltransferase